MKPRFTNSNHQRRRAATLIECLVYIGAFTVIIGVGTSAFYRCYDHMRALRRNADDITRVLKIGEAWRADIRGATAQPTFDTASQTLHITRRDAVIDYRFADNQLSRRATADGAWTSVLTNLNQCEMKLEQHSGVAAWRCELELRPLRKPARVQPLFTFTAVPEKLSAP